jgi:NADH:ubiquinone oxidoreductase subunit K
MVPLWMYLVVAAGLFCIGALGVLTRKSAVAILMGVELMLNAVNVNLVAFWRYNTPQNMMGQAFTAFVFVVAAAEAAVGLAIIIAVYRNRRSTTVDDVDVLKW